MKTSLVLATYNGEKYIVEQLDSIRLQTKQIDEVIICDDGSNDLTCIIVKEYIKKYNLDNWIFEVNKNNLGYALNFTEMLKRVTGDIIFLADQDDIWEKDKVSNMLNAFNENRDIQLLASNLMPLYMTSEAPKLNYENFNSKNKLIKIEFSGRWIKPIRPGCSFAIKKQLLKDYLKIWNSSLPHDCILWNIASLKNEAYLLNVSTMRYRRHASNASNLGNKSVNYRIESINEEICIMNLVLDNLDIDDKKVKFINKQIGIYKRRINNIKQKRILRSVFMFPYLKYYGRARFYLTDLYYSIRRNK